MSNDNEYPVGNRAMQNYYRMFSPETALYLDGLRARPGAAIDVFQPWRRDGDGIEPKLTYQRSADTRRVV